MSTYDEERNKRIQSLRHDVDTIIDLLNGLESNILDEAERNSVLLVDVVDDNVVTASDYWAKYRRMLMNSYYRQIKYIEENEENENWEKEYWGEADTNDTNDTNKDQVVDEK